MFRRFIITWFALSILGYGLAMAADVHNELSTDQTHIISDQLIDFSDAHNDSDCDHCCHGVLHLLGLISTGEVGFTVYCATSLSPYSITTSSLLS